MTRKAEKRTGGPSRLLPSASRDSGFAANYPTAQRENWNFYVIRPLPILHHRMYQGTEINLCPGNGFRIYERRSGGRIAPKGAAYSVRTTILCAPFSDPTRKGASQNYALGVGPGRVRPWNTGRRQFAARSPYPPGPRPGLVQMTVEPEIGARERGCPWSSPATATRTLRYINKPRRCLAVASRRPTGGGPIGECKMKQNRRRTLPATLLWPRLGRAFARSDLGS